MTDYPAPINPVEPLPQSVGNISQPTLNTTDAAPTEQTTSFNKKPAFSGKKMKLWAGLGVMVLLLATSIGGGVWLMGADKSTDDRSQASNIGITSTSLTLAPAGSIPTSSNTAEYGVTLKTNPTTTVVTAVRFDVSLPIPMVVSEAQEVSQEDVLVNLVVPQAFAQTIKTTPTPLPVVTPRPSVTPKPVVTPGPTINPTPTASPGRMPTTGTDFACTAEYSPVCGANGVTYGNSCEARRAGQTSYTPGSCASATPVPPTSATRTLLSENGVVVTTTASDRDLSVIQIELQPSEKATTLKVVANVSPEYAKSLSVAKEVFRVSIPYTGQIASTPAFTYRSVLGYELSNPSNIKELLGAPTPTPIGVTPPPATPRPYTPPPTSRPGTPTPIATPRPSVTPKPVVTPIPTPRPSATPVGITPPPATLRPTSFPSSSPNIPVIQNVQINRGTPRPTTRPTPTPTSRPWWQMFFRF